MSLSPRAYRALLTLPLVVAICWWISAHGWNSFLAVISASLPLIAYYVEPIKARTTYSYPIDTESHRLQARLALLERVNTTWVNGVYDNLLSGLPYLNLNISLAQQLVSASIRTLPTEISSHSQSLQDPQAYINSIIGNMRGSLLVLGNPGAGKTTLLLQTAKSNLVLAQQQVNAPVPVVFNLGSWSSTYPDIDTWLLDEFRLNYHIPPQIAQSLIDLSQIMLFLDGLDEVRIDLQEQCIQSLNQFRLNHGLISLIVSSRLQEYETISSRLILDSAIHIHPLTKNQIDTYLAKLGTSYDPLRDTITQDPQLLELAQNPLMLMILIKASTNLPREPDLTATLAEKRKHIFDAYVDHAFTRRYAPPRYVQLRAIKWLTWISNIMYSKQQNSFYIDQIQPDLLQSKYLLIVYNFLVFAVVASAVNIAVFLSWLFAGISDFSIIYLLFMVAEAVIVTALGHIRHREPLLWRAPLVRRTIKIFLVYSVIYGLLFFVIPLLSGSSLPSKFSWYLPYLLSIITYSLLGTVLIVFRTELTNSSFPIRNLTINAALNGLAFALIGVFCSLYSLSNTWHPYINFHLDVLPGSALTMWLFGFICFGGLSVLQHYVLRGLLYREGYIPWRLKRFLEFATGLIILQKVSNGYSFIHRLVLEYFVSLDDSYIRSPALLSALAGSLIASEQYDKGIEILSSVIEKQPRNLDAGQWLLIAFSKSHQLEKAIARAEKNLQVNKKDTITRMLLGAVYFEQEKYNECILEFRKISENDSLYTPVYRFLAGAALMQLERFSEAIPELQRVLEKNVHVHQTRSLLGKAFVSVGRYEDAIRELNFVIQEEPSNIESRLFLATSLYSTKRESEALDAVRQALSMAPNDASLNYCLGNMLLACERFEESLPPLQLALELDSENHQIRFKVGQCLAGLSREEEAITSIQEAIKQSSNCSKYHAALGLLYLGQEEHLKAIKELQEAIFLDSNEDVEIYRALTSCLTLLEQFSEAKTICEKGLTLYASNIELHRLLGIILQKLGNFKAAEEE